MLIYSRRKGIQNEKVKVIDEFLELWHREVAMPLVVVEMENLVSFMMRLITPEEDEGSEKFASRNILMELA